MISPGNQRERPEVITFLYLNQKIFFTICNNLSPYICKIFNSLVYTYKARRTLQSFTFVALVFNHLLLYGEANYQRQTLEITYRFFYMQCFAYLEESKGTLCKLILCQLILYFNTALKIINFLRSSRQKILNAWCMLNTWVGTGPAKIKTIFL